MATDLQFVETIDEIQRNLRQFANDVRSRAPQVSDIAQSAHYWVYDASPEEFAPSLLLAYRHLNLERYEKLRKIRHKGNAKRFDGTRARKKIEQLTGSDFATDKSLASRLSQLLQDVIGEEALLRIKKSKWRFATVRTSSNRSSTKKTAASPNGPADFGNAIQEAARAYGAGFGTPEENKRVEMAAVQFVANWYKSQNWTVKSVEGDKCGYDLICRRHKQERHVEVKGARGGGGAQQFVITSNEVRCAKTDPLFELFLVSNALSSPLPHRYSGQDFRSKFSLDSILFRASRPTAETRKRRNE